MDSSFLRHLIIKILFAVEGGGKEGASGSEAGAQWSEL